MNQGFTDTRVYDKTYQKYKNNVKKLMENTPINQSMAEARKEREEEEKRQRGRLKIDNDPRGPRARKNTNKYFVQFMLHIAVSAEDVQNNSPNLHLNTNSIRFLPNNMIIIMLQLKPLYFRQIS